MIVHTDRLNLVFILPVHITGGRVLIDTIRVNASEVGRTRRHIRETSPLSSKLSSFSPGQPTPMAIVENNKDGVDNPSNPAKRP